MKITNLTPHPIHIVRDDGTMLEVPTSGAVARVTQNQSICDEIDDIKVVVTSFGDILGLPEATKGNVYLVSSLVLQVLLLHGAPRKDVYAPDTGPSAFRRDGKIQYVTRLQKFN